MLFEALVATARERLHKTFYGWKIVAASCVVNAVGDGVYFYGFAVFFLPIKEALRLSSAATSLVFSLSRAEGAIEGPLAGYLIDRFGPRIVLTVGVIVVGIGYVLLSQVNSYAWFLVVYLGIISLAFNGSFSGSTIAVVNSWFVRKKGLAMGIIMASFGLGGFIASPLLGLGVHHLGWRMTAALAGVVVVVVATPFAQVMRRSPESMGLQPDGVELPFEASRRSENDRTSAAFLDFTVKEALQTSAYWLLAAATLLRIGSLGTLIVHFVPIMVWKGTTEQTASLLLGTMALASIPSRIGFGWLGDRWSRSKMLGLGMGLGVVAMLVLQSARSGWHLWIFVGIFSFVEGFSALNWALVGEFFGRSKFATLRGILSFVYCSGLIVLPVMAGKIFDHTGSYTVMLWVFVGMYAICTILFGLMKRPPPPSRLDVQAPRSPAGA